MGCRDSSAFPRRHPHPATTVGAPPGEAQPKAARDRLVLPVQLYPHHCVLGAALTGLLARACTAESTFLLRRDNLSNADTEIVGLVLHNTAGPCCGSEAPAVPAPSPAAAQRCWQAEPPGTRTLNRSDSSSRGLAGLGYTDQRP